MAQGVAAQDVEVHRNWAQAVGGVQVAVAVQVVLQAPAVLVVGGVEHHHAQVVQIGALGVGQCAEDAFLDHLHDPELLAVVAAVLQHDAVALGLLGDLYEVNGFLVGRGDGDLAGGVQALPHGVASHGRVPFPWRADEGQVSVVGVAGGLPRVVVAGEDLRCGILELADAGLGLLDFLGVDVADGGDLGVAFADEPFEHVDEARSAVAEADEGHAHLGQGFGLEVKDGALQPGLGHAFLEEGVEVFVGGLSLESTGGHQSAQTEESTPEEFPSLHGLKIGRCGLSRWCGDRWVFKCPCRFAPQRIGIAVGGQEGERFGRARLGVEVHQHDGQRCLGGHAEQPRLKRLDAAVLGPGALREPGDEGALLLGGLASPLLHGGLGPAGLAAVDETGADGGQEGAKEGPPADGGLGGEARHRAAGRHQQGDVEHGLVVGDDHGAASLELLQGVGVAGEGPGSRDFLQARNPLAVDGLLHGGLVFPGVVPKCPAGAAQGEYEGPQRPEFACSAAEAIHQAFNRSSAAASRAAEVGLAAASNKDRSRPPMA